MRFLLLAVVYGILASLAKQDLQTTLQNQLKGRAMMLRHPVQFNERTFAADGRAGPKKRRALDSTDLDAPMPELSCTFSARPAGGCFLPRFRGFAFHQLIEIALLSARGLLLDQQSKTALVEFVEPCVPADFFQRLLAAIAGEIQAEQSHVFLAAGPAHASGMGSTLFGPAANLIMVGENVRFSRPGGAR